MFIYLLQVCLHLFIPSNICSFLHLTYKMLDLELEWSCVYVNHIIIFILLCLFPSFPSSLLLWCYGTGLECCDISSFVLSWRLSVYTL